MSKLWEFPPALVCQYCDVPLFYQDEHIEEIFRDYFHGKNPVCPSGGCGKDLDWWNTVLHTIRGKSRHTDPLMAVGARQTVFQIRLRPDKPILIRFTDYKILTDARILRVRYHAAHPDQSGGLTPLEMHGVRPHRYTVPPEITLYPAPVGDLPARETDVNVAVLWVPTTPDNEGWHQLVVACDAYEQGNYRECIVPANVAVEATIAPILSSYMEQVASKEHVKRFLEDGATYSHQLNVLLPALLRFTTAPKLSDHIRGQLNRLRAFRNDVAHRGSTEKPLSKNEASECLCAALFGFHYLRLVRPILLDFGSHA